MRQKTARLSRKSHAIMASTLAVTILGLIAFVASGSQAARALTASEQAFVTTVKPLESTLIALEADPTVDHKQIRPAKKAIHILNTLQAEATGQSLAFTKTVHPNTTNGAPHRALSADETHALTTTEKALKTYKASHPRSKHGRHHGHDGHREHGKKGPTTAIPPLNT